MFHNVPHCSHKAYLLCYYYLVEMRKKFFAIIGALIAGGLGIAVASSVESAHAATALN
jgi:hypothetical protein